MDPRFLRQLGSAFTRPALPVRRGLHWAWELQHRERLRLQDEMAQVRGLMPLLMKQRNGYRWTEADRRKIRAQLRQLAALSPYLVPRRREVEGFGRPLEGDCGVANARDSTRYRCALRLALTSDQLGGTLHLPCDGVLVLFLSPGGFIALPLLAWWLDRRRQRRLQNKKAAAE